MIFIALGANLPSRFGPPPETLAACCAVLERKGLIIVAASSLWLSAPVPVSDQPWFHNAVIRIETQLAPAAVMVILKEIENDFGRVRVNRNEARILDLDLIAWDDDIFDTPALTIPHPRMAERAFVLLPLQEIAPGWIHPALNKKLADLVAALPPQDIRQGETLR